MPDSRSPDSRRYLLPGPYRLEELEPRDTPAFLGLPTFSAGITLPTVGAVRDFNGDGLLDVAVGNSTGGPGGVPYIGIALGDGRGGFTQVQAITDAVLSVPRAMAVADLTNDGRPDLVVGSADPANPSGGGSTLVFPGVGDGTFGPPTFLQQNRTRAVAVGDFNRDGITDLVTADATDAPGYRVYLGTVAGTLVTTAPFQPASLTTDRLAVADFDGDGKLDFVGSDPGTFNLVFVYGNGDGTFSNPQLVPSSGDGEDLVVADFDGDGRPDVVLSGDVGTIFIRNLGARQYAGGMFITPSGQSDVRLAAADVDRNGLPDVIGVDFAEAHVYLSTGGGTFTQDPAGPYPLAGPAIGVDVLAGDVDGDGNVDFIVPRAGSDGTANDGQVFINLAPDFTRTTLSPVPNPSFVNQPVTLLATVTPLVPPLPAGSTPTGTVTFLADGVALGTATLTNGVASITVSTLAIGAHTLSAAYSGDTAFLASGAVSALQVLDTPPPQTKVYTYLVTGIPTVPGAGADRVTIGQFTGDDVADIVLGAGPGRPAGVTLIDGNTRQVLADVQPFGGDFTGGVVLAAGDIDGDGVADLAVAADIGGGPRVRVYLSRDGQLTPTVDFFALDPGFRGGLRVALGDVNHDGYADLVVTGGPGSGPRVATYDGRTLGEGMTPARLWNDFFAFDPELRTGLNVAVGDLNGDGYAEIVVAADVGGSPRVALFDGRSVAAGDPNKVADFFTGPTEDRGGVRIAIRDVDGDGIPELVTGSGPGSESKVGLYSGATLYAGGDPVPFLETDAIPGLTSGIYVA